MRARDRIAIAASLLLLGGAAPALAEATGGPRRLTADQCVAIALRESGLVGEAAAKVEEWKGRLAEVQSIFYPKLFGLGYVAPIFRVRGDHLAPDVERDYSEWGPYFHLQAVLAQPLYAFGRGAAGKQAAGERARVEEARLVQTRNLAALEVRKLYYTYLFAKSMRPALDSARQLLDKAQKKAQEEYEANTGKVTNVDLQKLVYASAELDKYRIQAEVGEGLALAALKHTMGLPASEPLLPAEDMLPSPPESAVPSLAELLKRASERRPEWAQIRHGKQAALSLAQAERLANAPLVFAAAQIDANYSPMRPDIQNPYAFDEYNRVIGGLALGLQFDLDPAKARGKARQAEAIGAQVDALAKFAATGIPLEVRKAHADYTQAQRTVPIADTGAVAARKWMIFAGAAFSTGTGEAKDVLEGLVAYLASKKGHYEALQALHVARAYVAYATGGTGL